MRWKSELSRCLRQAVCVLLCMVVSGCAEDLRREDFGKIRKGMARSEVEILLGEGRQVPWEKVASRLSGIGEVQLSETSCDVWLQWGNRKGLGLVGFKDDKVTQLFFD